MPNVFRRPINGYRLFFYSNEGSEPPHVHVQKAENAAKFWIDPVKLDWNEGFSSQQISFIEKMIRARKTRILNAWNEYFTS
ncbi:MAG: DUF4160 domain-containing protein [Bacteroidota bacterium]|nr:DUF4160 domain-containing protein [Bacteroidota bacterium]MDP4230478.1 DUF4160 domain-containing protein [Bacteroidota bacterium]MDP4236450.1 DUF4160 domain-containing protein [Bacteroidota bacterium]